MRLYILQALILLLLLTPSIGFAQEFVPMQKFSGLQNINNLTTEGYINALFTLAIGAAALLTVVRLMLAGVQYMFSEVVTDKGKAKQDIQSALLGLLIILGTITILNTINPELTKLNIFNLAQYKSTLEGSAPTQPEYTYSCEPGYKYENGSCKPASVEDINLQVPGA